MHSKLIILFLFVFAFVFTQNIKAQSDDLSVLEQIVEEIAEQSDEGIDYAELYENLIVFYYNPLNLNTVDDENLYKLHFLTRFQIMSIVAYRERYKGFKSIYELQFVDGIDQQTLKYLLPFVIVESGSATSSYSVKNALKYGRHDVMIRTQSILQNQIGYMPISDSLLALDPDKQGYLGSKYKLYSRYRYHYKDKVFWGITAEKDQGEEFFKGSQPNGFDYYSAHLQINDIGFVKTAILGDYKLEFGQGLTLWSGMSFGKSSDALNIMKMGRGIMRYGSSNENEFLRGGAARLRFGNFDFTEFVSYKNIDAKIVVDSLENNEDIATSFLNTGNHRTNSELSVKHNIKEFIAGGNVTWRTKHIKIGATAAYFNYSSPLQARDVAYNYFAFSGSENINAGIDYMAGFKHITAFGEVSMSKNMGYAYLNGLSLDLVPEVKLTLLQRHYEPNYQAMLAVPFSEGNSPENESGIYIGARVFPIKKWRIDAYVDFWKYPFLRYQVDAPSDGKEYLLQVMHYPRRNIDMYWRVKYEQKEKNFTGQESGTQQLQHYEKMYVRYNIKVSPDSRLELKTRIEYSRYKLENTSAENGFMIAQGITYRPYEFPMRIAAHFAVFSTDSYNTRIYSYEPDVLYAFTVPAYYSRGSRIALLVKYRFFDSLDVWLRFSDTFFYDKDVIGSGLTEIEGKHRSEIKMQVRYKF